MVRAGIWMQACDLFYDRLQKAIYYQFGAYQLQINFCALYFSTVKTRRRRLKKDDDQAWTLNGLANAYGNSGQPRRAVPLFGKGKMNCAKRWATRKISPADSGTWRGSNWSSAR